MLLYLTSNQKSGLIDGAAHEMLMPSKKLVGKFSLKSFVTKDMRNYATAKFFLIDAACIEESGEDFTLALRSFQMMFSARIIVILSGCEDMSGCTGEHYVIDGIDGYLTNEPDRDYQFIIYDCGVIQTPTSVFREADHRLLCGSVLPYEIPAFHKALEVCGGLEVRPVAISVPGEFRAYCRELFGGEMEMAEASHDLFANRTNGRLYKRLIEPYIMGERRL